MSCLKDVIYSFDGSFEGLLCCVFESYLCNEIPSDIITAGEPSLLPVKEIPTDFEKSDRVLTSVPKRMGQGALDFIRFAFLTCLPQKEYLILLFFRLGFAHGAKVMSMLTDETVNSLNKAVRHLEKEAHLLKGFLRFSVFDNILVAEAEPKNFVLPLLVRHFCERYPNERFLIYDKTHGMALVYQPYSYKVIPMEDFALLSADKDEAAYRALWRLFYDTIEIESRHNPKCRLSHMPKRYWKYMTEFAYPAESAPRLDENAKGLLL